ncbi:MAG: hypothetical protein FWB83_07345, partial [Treponema sp.]|nr:hypothetical protein [Treponema sp.]
MKKKEKSKLENAHVYNKEAKLHQYNKEWDKAIACFLKAMEFADDDDDFKIFYDSLLDVCRDKQIAQPFEERMAPYVKMMELIKDETAKPIGECLNFQYISDYTEFATVLAVYEEYDLLKRLINEAANSKLQIPESFLKTIFSKRSKPGFPQKKLTGPTLHVYSLLNTHLNPQFAHWGPTPLYLITSKNAVKRIKDIKKLLKFLVDNGADLNINARDRSNILLNQTARDCENIELLQIILELGADPDNSGLFIDDETDLTPLIHSLRPGYIEDENENEEDDDEDSGYITPFSEIAVKKAVLLLEHGADPNLLSSTILDDLSPLTMAIKYGFITQDGPVKGESPEGILELIKLLIKKGANVNFTDSNNNTPLSIAVNNNLSDVVNILKKKRAKMPVEKKKKEDTPEDL